MEDVHGIVIVGGGISGLATALALHRKGMGSLVLEKSETLRADGVAITFHANGWRALDNLGVGTELRELAILITEEQRVWPQMNKTIVAPTRISSRLAKHLPARAIRFGCGIAAIDAANSRSHGAILTTVDGRTMKAKVLIGCDGANTVVAKFLGLSKPSQLPCLGILGLTTYPKGHPFGSEYLHLLGKGYAFGQIPVTENIVHFYTNLFIPSTDSNDPYITNDASRGEDYALRKLQECQCPAEIAETMRHSDQESLKILTRMWYRPPWRLVLGSFQRGTVTVAGDAMYVMGPFNGQGGAAALEDAVVLARSLSQAVPPLGVDADAEMKGHGLDEKIISKAIGRYVQERRPRVVRLSLESFVIGTLLGVNSLVKKLVCRAIMAVLGTKSRFQENFDCGRL